MTSEATLEVRAPPPQLPDLPEQGGTMDQEDVAEPEETDDLRFRPDYSTVDNAHQLRAVSPKTQAYSQAKSMELNEPSTVSSESPNSDTSSRDGSDSSAFDNGAPTPTAARTAARQIGAH